jgi:hypothetical protein
MLAIYAQRIEKVKWPISLLWAVVVPFGHELRKKYSFW